MVIDLFLKRKSFFLNLNELPPATNLKIKVNLKKYQFKYWNVKFNPIEISEEETYREIKNYCLIRLK